MTPVSRMVLVTLCSAVLLISGCASNQLSKPDSPDAMLVVGNMDMTDAISTLSEVDVERLSPDPQKVVRKFKASQRNDSFTFFSIDLPPGQYRIVGFGGWMGRNGMWYDVKDVPLFAKTFTFSKSRVNYVGSYKLIKHMPPGMVGKMTFEFVQVKGPGEREALQRILNTWEMDPYWKTMIEKRLKELPK